MECLDPIHLKSGLWVPCGHCTLCESQSRVDKSVAVQIHVDSYDRMPLMIGLSYSPEYLPYRHVVSGRFWRANEITSIVDDKERKRLVPTVYRRDVSAFIKSYKRIHGLYNDTFTYFGCGEYGGDGDAYGVHRPHYHLIWFGDTFLENLYDQDVQKAERWLAEFWQYGHVDICQAEWGGIHYVSKYCLKENRNVPDGAHDCFSIVGKGIGNNWLKSVQAERIRQQYLYLQFNKERIFSDIADMAPDNDDDIYGILSSLENQREYLVKIMPDFRITLPSGARAYLPRKLRRKVVGTFRTLNDNPFVVYQDICQLIDSLKYTLDHPENVKDQFTTYIERLTTKANFIEQRIKRNKRRL